MAPEALAHVLRPLSNLFNSDDYPNLLIGLGLADDAAIYRLNDREALVATLDFFTPIVDDPYAYGAIAAANAMGDVYAMGGRVLFALNVAAFPGDLPYDVIGQVLKGGADKVREAGAAIAGGHTIQDKEPKYGLVVLGMVDPNRILTKGGAQAGDLLVLTKPLGTGVITTAFMRDLTSEEQMAAATTSMLQLNQAASEAALAAGVRAATDITGFGLLGHASEMVQATAKIGASSSITRPSPAPDDRSPILEAGESGSPITDRRATAFRFHFSHLPWLPGAREFGREWVYPGGAHNNLSLIHI
jgi:selenide,water dikinase